LMLLEFLYLMILFLLLSNLMLFFLVLLEGDWLHYQFDNFLHFLLLMLCIIVLLIFLKV
jgi:hypothetical protein